MAASTFERYAPVMVRAGAVVVCVVALGCGGAHPARPATAAPSPSCLVYVTGEDGVLERRSDDASAGWNQACAGSCGQYLPASGTYRLRRREVASAPFSLPVADMGRVVLRFDGDGRVWAQPTPRALRQAQPFVPQFVLFLR